MSVFQLLMLGASAFFAYKIFEHIQTLKDPQDRVEEPKDANAFSPFDPEALIKKADDAFENKEHEKAFALLSEANIKEPGNPDTLFKIAYILQLQDDNEEAIKYYKEALAADSNNEYIHNAIASLYRKNGEFISAKMHLQDSIELNNQNPITYYNYGNLLVDMKKNEEALRMYEKALEINPDFSEAKEEMEKIKKEE
ncbi:tetratricopeptide repeat protein [bacterium]|nr:tetratricopeptide repeat protein [bacterium]MBU1995331.1 tetratricopeptide repeat protein [bacterium]